MAESEHLNDMQVSRLLTLTLLEGDCSSSNILLLLSNRTPITNGCLKSWQFTYTLGCNIQ